MKKEDFEDIKFLQSELEQPFAFRRNKDGYTILTDKITVRVFKINK